MKVINFVIDASVAVKWFSDETHHKEAVKILQDLEKNRYHLLAPELLLYEVANALWKGKKLESKDIKTAIDNLMNMRIEFYQFDKFVFFQAVDFMVNYDLTFYDAVYGALAFSSNIPLISANPKHHKKMKEIKVLDIAKF